MFKNGTFIGIISGNYALADTVFQPFVRISAPMINSFIREEMQRMYFHLMDL